MPDVISNTSCLIALSNISRLDLLEKRYGQIIVTPEVANEYGVPLPSWIMVKQVNDPIKIQFILNSLDLGEASVIALATEYSDPLVVLDDGKARKYAAGLGIKLTGTLGIILKCLDFGIIAKHELMVILSELQRNNFRLPQNLDKLIP
jgi:predicted nucleic acid-binding protein